MASSEKALLVGWCEMVFYSGDEFKVVLLYRLGNAITEL